MVEMLRTPKNTGSLRGRESGEKGTMLRIQGYFRDCILLAYHLPKRKLKFMEVRIILFNLID